MKILKEDSIAKTSLHNSSLYQDVNQEIQSLKAGDVVVIPENVKHWHKVKKHFWFNHIAIKVSDEEY